MRPRFFSKTASTSFVFIIMGLTATLMGCAGDSKIERGLAHERLQAGGNAVTMSIRSIRCSAPQNGKATPCLVTFDDEYELPAVTVDVPAGSAEFPAEFEFEHWWDELSVGSRNHGGPLYASRIRTLYDGTSLSAAKAGAAIALTTETAARLAITATGAAYERQRVRVENLRSYGA